MTASTLLAFSAQPADRAFLRALASGDARAVRALYDAHARYVAGVLFRLLPTRDDEALDDLVQETFLAALGAIDSVETPEALRGFLATIAVRKAIRTLSKRRRHRVLNGFFSLFGATQSDPRTREPADDLLDSLARLPEDLRVPWVLARVEDWTLPEVAKACAMSLATTKRRIALAEEHLKRRLAP